jgi:lipopolysaccharide transport system permease protein
MRWVLGHFRALAEIVALLTRYRQLTWEMTRREITDRYAGQVFGTLWGLGHPLVLIAVYVFVFAYVFKVRIGGTADLPLDYTTYLLAGLIPWLAFQESMSKASTVITAHSNLVKQVVFPIEVLPVKGVIVAGITQSIGTAALIVYVLVSHGSLPLMYLLLPVVFLLHVLAMVGVAYVLSAIGVYFRDAKDFVQVFCTVGVFVIPVMYLPAQVPALFRPIVFINPFSYVIWCYQDVLYYGRFEHPWAWVVFPVGSVLIFSLGYRLFRILKTFFGSVL